MGGASFLKRGDGMLVSLDEVKEYLRVDDGDEDGLIGGLLDTAGRICMDVARVSDELDFSQNGELAKTAVMFAVAYLYEHREAADHGELLLTLRSLLSGVRREEF